MLSPSRFRRIFRASAQYDLALSAIFAVAPGVALVWWGMGLLSPLLGLAPPAPLDANAIMFANFFGTVVTIWAVVRLRFDLPVLARYDAAGRLFFALAMITALTNGASPILWAFLIVETLFAMAQLLPVTGRSWSNP
jgi:hypothetical protein